MTSYVPPIKNGAGGWIGYISLAPRTANGQWQNNPTLASGDVKLAKDGGALTDLGTLPVVTPAGSDLVKITLSQSECNADNLTIEFKDAAGSQWCDLTINLQTVARQIDDLAFPTVSGRSMDVSATGGVEADGGSIASVSGNVGGVATGGIVAGSFAANAIDNTALAANAVTEIQAGLSTAAQVAALNNISTAQVNAEADQALIDAGVTSAVMARLDVSVSSRLAAASYTPPDNATIAAIDAKTTNLPVDPADQSLIIAATNSLAAAIAALNNLSSSQILSGPLTESYAANGAIPTLEQAILAIHQHLMHFDISGVNRTVKKLNGTAAFVETLNHPTSATALTR